MESVSEKNASATLQVLADMATARGNLLPTFQNIPDVDSDEENIIPFPIFDTFYKYGGATSISNMCNFTPRELQMLWEIVKDAVNLG